MFLGTGVASGTAYSPVYTNYIHSILCTKEVVSITTNSDTSAYNMYVCLEYTKFTD